MPTAQRIKNTLSLKLTLVFFSVSLLLSITLWQLISRAFEQNYIQNTRPYLLRYVDNLQRNISYPPNLRVAENISLNLVVDVIITRKDGTIFWRSNNTEFNERLFVKWGERLRGEMIVEDGDYAGQFYMRFIAPELDTIIMMREKQANTLNWQTLVTLFSVLLLCLFALYWFTRQLFSPIQAIEKSVKALGDGGLSQALSINRTDELGSLANSVNKTANNIENMLEAKRQLLLAISHELRTPITRSKIALSLMDDSSAKHSIEEDLHEMEALIHELLESERLKAKHAVLDLESCNINDIVHQVHGRYFADDPIVFELDEQITDQPMDAKRLSFVIKNLLKNALNAQKEDSHPICLQTQQTENQLHIQVKDNGIGIAPENIALIVEPFYRIDHSRQRKTGGVGIGLYLVKLIIEAHGGQLNIASVEGHGTTMSVSLPKNMTVDNT